ncbi:alpha/beta hydrolase [Intrasporangium sp. DVR]|uniref:alpha/beta fold hydrolase n=1 Tax=Intrasporangium sp. DVR TaxID=3127867 RepID=UPI00313A5763
MTALHPSAPTGLAEPWGGRSRVSDLGGPVHWVDFTEAYAAGPGSPGQPPPSEVGSAAPLVLVHGLGGSHLNWVHVAPALAEHRRVVAIDLAGFGLTPAAGRDTGVRANAALLGRFVDEVLGEPAVLVGNSMGGMVSIMLAHSRPERVAGLVLVDPSVPSGVSSLDRLVALQFGVYATPLVGEQFLVRMRRRYTTEQRVTGTIRLCFADASRADAAVLAAGAALLSYRDELARPEAEFLRAARSLLTVLRRGRAYSDLIRSVAAPVLLIHGEQDRLVPVAAARRIAAANPHWETEWLADVGHTPQLEAPERFVEIVNRWLGSPAGDPTPRRGPARRP